MLSLNFSLSIGSGYLLTPLVKNRARAHCKPAPPVRFTIISHSGRVVTQPPHGGWAAHGIALSFAYSFTVYAVHIIQSLRALAGPLFQALAAAQSRIRSARVGSAVRL